MSNQAPSLGGPPEDDAVRVMDHSGSETTLVLRANRFRMGAQWLIHSEWASLLAPLLGAVALVLLTQGALLVGARFAKPHLRLTASAPRDSPALNGFYSVYCDKSACYRWSAPDADILLTGLDCSYATLDLRLAAIRPVGMLPPTVALSVPNYHLGALSVSSTWRHYRILMPCGTASDIELHLQSDSFQPGDHDRRQLGVAFSRLDAWPVDSTGMLPSTPRASFLLALPLLAALLIGFSGGRLRFAMGLGVVFAGVAGWAAASPVLSGYVLPTLTLRQTPWAPLFALLAAPLIIRRFYGAVPGASWSGCALVLVALIILRLGREVAFGLTTLLLSTLVVVAHGQATRRSATGDSLRLERRSITRTANPSAMRLLPALTGLRFFAAFAVVLYHYQRFLPHPPVLQSLFDLGPASVGLFFVLSGFILTYTYMHWFTDDLTRFWSYIRARFARIFPIYALALTLGTLSTLALLRIYEEPRPTTVELEAAWFLSLFLVNDYVPFPQIDIDWSLPSWSIARECVFYLVFPFFIRYGLQRLNRIRSLVILALACYGLEILTFTIGMVLCQRLFSDASEFTSAAVRYVYQSPFTRIWEFLIGAILGAVFLRTQLGDRASASLPAAWIRNAILSLALLASALIATAPLSDGPAGEFMQFTRWYLAYTPCFAILIMAIAWGPTFLTALLEHRWIVRLGEASYALFLIHDIPHYLLPIYIDRNDWRTPWIVLAIIGACIVASLALYRFVETPARQWLRKEQIG
jgi:peptidoglycan/LPS O-acetylase OafA/YrhL